MSQSISLPTYPTLPYPTLRYATLRYPTLPYPTLPYPTLPYPAYPAIYLTFFLSGSVRCKEPGETLPAHQAEEVDLSMSPGSLRGRSGEEGRGFRLSFFGSFQSKTGLVPWFFFGLGAASRFKMFRKPTCCSQQALMVCCCPVSSPFLSSTPALKQPHVSGLRV